VALALGSGVDASGGQGETQIGGTISIEGSLSAGNVERTLLTLRGDATWSGAMWALVVEPVFVYGEQSTKVREREIRARHFVYLRPRARWFGFALVSLEASHQRQIDERWQAGVGVGRKLLDISGHRLRVTAALLRERSRFDDRERRDEWRATLRVKGSHESGPFRWQEEVWWQPGLGSALGHRFHALCSLDTRIKGPLAFRISADENYDGGVTAGLRPNDIRLSLGIVIGRGAAP
jgi:Protein of unknown function, DUF481